MNKLAIPVKEQKPLLKYMPNSSAYEVAQLLRNNSRIIGLTRGQFSLIDLIYEVLKIVGRSDVICATWSAGIKDANTVKWMMDTDLIKSYLLVTDHSYVTRQAKYAVELTSLFGEKNIRTSDLHAKFCLIQNDNYYITIRTSMNLNANRTCENFEIDNSDYIYKFYKNFIVETFGEMPEGFVGNSAIVSNALDRVFLKLNHFSWQSNE